MRIESAIRFSLIYLRVDDMVIDLNEITSVEFGICLREKDAVRYYLIPTDEGLKELLKQMLGKTIDAWERAAEAPSDYNPAQRYHSVNRLKIATNNDWVTNLKDFYNLENITTDSGQITNLQKIFAYFCIFRTKDRTKIVAVRRASQFKLVSKQKFVSFLDDTLSYVDKKLFKIDNDFDFIITSAEILIYRVTGFERFADLEEVILQKAEENTVKLGEKLPFIDIAQLKIYNSGHIRAARLIASILSRPDLQEIDVKMLKRQCRDKNVKLEEINGKITPREEHEFAFLHVLDRRRYSITLIPRRKEIYEASSRDQV